LYLTVHKVEVEVRVAVPVNGKRRVLDAVLVGGRELNIDPLDNTGTVFHLGKETSFKNNDFPT
jgi:hypothetical protein